MSDEWAVGSGQWAAEQSSSVLSPQSYGASVLIADVSQQFGTVPALSDVSLTVRQGEFVCLVGPSGCGKTSLLRILAGLAQPTSGSVAVAGRVATLFQGPSLFPWRTAIDNGAYRVQHG